MAGGAELNGDLLGAVLPVRPPIRPGPVGLARRRRRPVAGPARARRDRSREVSALFRTPKLSEISGGGGREGALVRSEADERGPVPSSPAMPFAGFRIRAGLRATAIRSRCSRRGSTRSRCSASRSVRRGADGQLAARSAQSSRVGVRRSGRATVERRPDLGECQPDLLRGDADEAHTVSTSAWYWRWFESARSDVINPCSS